MRACVGVFRRSSSHILSSDARSNPHLAAQLPPPATRGARAHVVHGPSISKARGARLTRASGHSRTALLWARGAPADLLKPQNRALRQRARLLSFAFEPTPEHSITPSRSNKHEAKRRKTRASFHHRAERERGPLSNPCRAGRADFLGSQMRRCVSKEPLLMPPQLRRPSLK